MIVVLSVRFLMLFWLVKNGLLVMFACVKYIAAEAAAVSSMIAGAVVAN